MVSLRLIYTYSTRVARANKRGNNRGLEWREVFAEFHTRSAFSFLEAASLPEDLVQRATDLGHCAMALMDRDNLCGAPRFYMAAKKIGAKAHIGAEVTGEDGALYPLLVENRTG